MTNKSGPASLLFLFAGMMDGIEGALFHEYPIL